MDELILMLHDLLKNYEMILASGSPRRRQLLAEMGIAFHVETRPVDEKMPPDYSPHDAAVYLSKLKAAAFPESFFSSHKKLVITADTVVALENMIFGKPEHRNQAIKMLQQLSGKTHEVLTGVTLRTRRKQHSFAAVTQVTFKRLSVAEIIYYVDTFKPFDKAGAYGIQEWIGHAAIERIEGSYFNVVGLPTHRLYEALCRFVSE